MKFPNASSKMGQMSDERLTPEQQNQTKKNSRYFEEAWRIFTNRKDYSDNEVIKACRFLEEEWNNYQTGVDSAIDDAEAKEINSVFMGTLHYPGFQIPPELKYHPNDN